MLRFEISQIAHTKKTEHFSAEGCFTLLHLSGEGISTCNLLPLNDNLVTNSKDSVINLIADFEKRPNIFNFRPFKLEAFIVITRDALHVIRISDGHPPSYFSIYFGY